MIDLSDLHLHEVRQILHRYVPECEVRAFGSRVHGRSRPYSDLDLVLMATDGAIPEPRLQAIKEAFAESDLPMRVDVLDWNAIPESFRQAIMTRYEVVQSDKGS